MTKQQTQTAALEQFATTLKSNGFTVLISKKFPYQWLHFSKDNQIGSVSAEHVGYGFTFNTVHRPNIQCGTGFTTSYDGELSIENADDALSLPIHAQEYIQYIKPYKDVHDFILAESWAEYYIL